jgi:cobalt-zinc-cadmium efflux system outer membrane protein
MGGRIQVKKNHHGIGVEYQQMSEEIRRAPNEMRARKGWHPFRSQSPGRVRIRFNLFATTPSAALLRALRALSSGTGGMGKVPDSAVSVPLKLLLLAACAIPAAFAQHAYTWQELRDKFQASNPTIQAARLAVDESRASEITAYLRPNPGFTATLDQIDPFTPNPYRPLGSILPATSVNYLHERQHKRELRRDSARVATTIAESTLADQERGLLFNLRAAFVQILRAKSVLQTTHENLGYWDKVLRLSRERLKAGDIAQIDLDRLELQRIQFESDLQTAEVNLRTAKIQLLQLLNERTLVDDLDVTGTFDFPDEIPPLEELRKVAFDTRPDLRASLQTAEKAISDHKLALANGSADPTFSVDLGRNPPISAYFGVSVTVPLRIFDRNQGEKLRTDIDIRRTTHLVEAARSQIFSDVDSAYAQTVSSIILLKPYKASYLQQAERVRDTVAFAYKEGGATLLDFLNAENEYRSIRLNYLNLLGSYLTSAAQLNLAAGREVIQ